MTKHLSKAARWAASFMLVCLALLGASRTAFASAAFSGADSRIVYQGRTLGSSWPYSPDGRRTSIFYAGSEIHIKFTGSTSVQWNIRCTDDYDSSGNLIDAAYPNGQFYAYQLDGQWLTNSDGSLRHDNFKELSGTYTIATGLDKNATHTLVIHEDAESVGIGWMESLVLDDGAVLLQADPLSGRRIEFYGDSVTESCCGYAPPGTTPDPNSATGWQASNLYTYDGLVAQAFGADARVIAKGGMGETYSQSGVGHLQDSWNHVAPSAGEPLYDLTQWTPAVVVLAIGQNDSSQIGQGGDYTTAYNRWTADYLNQYRNLRSAYPGALIICMNTTMTDPSFFTGTDGRVGPLAHLQNDSEFASDRNTGKLVVKTFASQGYGEHPNGVYHKQMADALISIISGATGWTTGGSTGGGTSSASFVTGLESGDAQPTWSNSQDTDSFPGATNVSGFLSGGVPECGVRGSGDWGSINAHTGGQMLMTAGSAGGAATDFVYFKVFDLAGAPLKLTSQSTISYWINPLEDNGRYVAVDLHCTDGTTLRDSGITDQNGASLHPNAGHGGNIPLGSWSQITASLAALSGKTVDRVWVGYDRPNSSGQFRAYLDDINISTGSPTNLTAN